MNHIAITEEGKGTQMNIDKIKKILKDRHTAAHHQANFNKAKGKLIREQALGLAEEDEALRNERDGLLIAGVVSDLSKAMGFGGLYLDWEIITEMKAAIAKELEEEGF